MLLADKHVVKVVNRFPSTKKGGIIVLCKAPWRVLWAFQVAASNHGVAFRGARAEQDNGKPTCQLFCSTAVKTFHLVAATIQEQSHIKFV